MGKYLQRMRRDAAARAHMVGRNAYRCDKCGKYTVTVDMAEGTTPARLGCRATEGCKGFGQSLGYPEPWPSGVPRVPTHEWYRPDDATLARLRRERSDLAEHVDAGGLLIRARRKVIA